MTRAEPGPRGFAKQRGRPLAQEAAVERRTPDNPAASYPGVNAIVPESTAAGSLIKIHGMGERWLFLLAVRREAGKRTVERATGDWSRPDVLIKL